MAKRVLSPTGIDLIELTKARAFYRRHKRRLGGLLSAGEIAYVRTGTRPHVRLAELLAAKEAVFKAHGGAWMGMTGFSRARIRPASDGLRYRYAGEGTPASGRITVVKNADFVVALAGPACAGI